MFLQKLKKRVLVVLLVCLMFTVTLVFKLGPGPGTGMSEYNMGNEVIKTLIWTSPNNPPNLGTLTRLRKLVSHLNAENGEHCKLTNMDQHLQCEFSTRADAVEGVDAVAVYMPNADEFTEYGTQSSYYILFPLIYLYHLIQYKKLIASETLIAN